MGEDPWKVKFTYDRRGRAHLPKGYLPTPEEKDVVEKNVINGIFKSLIASALVSGPLYHYIGLKRSDLPRRKIGTLTFTLGVGVFAAQLYWYMRQGLNALAKLDSPMGEQVRYNANVSKGLTPPPLGQHDIDSK